MREIHFRRDIIVLIWVVVCKQVVAEFAHLGHVLAEVAEEALIQPVGREDLVDLEDSQEKRDEVEVGIVREDVEEG